MTKLPPFAAVTTLTALLMALACGSSEPEPAPPTSAEPPSPATPAAAPARESAWELTVGEAAFSGPVVMPANVGLFRSYGLATSGFSGSFSLLKEHESEPHTVQLSFMDTGEMCIYRDDNKNVSSGLVVERKGDRYVVSGDIGCGPVKGGTKTARRVSGFFKAKPL